ncbi:MAG: hypothetical protein V3U79_04810 [Dehalococcoidia bacterium]
MNYAQLRAMANSGSIPWHVMDVGGRVLWDLIGEGVLENLDTSVVDNRDFAETARTPYGAGGGITWSKVLAYNTDTYGTNPSHQLGRPLR